LVTTGREFSKTPRFELLETAKKGVSSQRIAPDSDAIDAPRFFEIRSSVHEEPTNRIATSSQIGA
jgi:hypothetical protein